MALKKRKRVSAIDAGRKQEQVESWSQQDSADSIPEKSHNGQLLLQAAKDGDAASLELLLGDDQLDPNVKNRDNCTPLLLAVLSKSTMPEYWVQPRRMYDSVARLLLAHGKINPNCQDSDGRTPLSHAAERGHSSLIERLLEHKDIEPNCTDPAGHTPLSRAAAASQVQAVRMLIKHRLIPESKDTAGRTSLSWAVKCFETGGFGILTMNQQCGSVELLLSLDNIDPDSRDNEGRTPLSWAITYLPSAQVELPRAFQTLLDRSSKSLSSKDFHGRTLLSRAAEVGQKTVITKLLQKGINPDMKDDDGRTPLSRAAAEGHLLVVSLLLQKSVDPDSRDEADRTPLWWAAERGHKAVIESLLANKAEANSIDQDLRTPLFCAVKNKHAAAIKLLIKRDKITLHILAQDGALAPLRFLLTEGSNVDSRNINRRTPLHIAAKSGHFDIAEELLCKKADINCKDTDGKTPLLLALEGKHRNLVELLLKHSAQTKDIMSAQWLDAYGKGQSEVLVDLSQSPCGRQSLQFVKAQQLNMSSKIGPARRLLLSPNYSTWSRCPPCSSDSILKPDKSEIFSGYKYYDGFHAVFIVGTFPTKEMQMGNPSPSLVSRWSEQAIAWHILQPSRPKDGSCWKSTEHFSTLPYGWIPANGADFFALFVRQLKVKWLDFGATAQKRLSQYRLDQLHAKGKNSDKLIDCLAEDAHKLAQLRSDFKGQLQSAQRFVVEYCGKYDDDGGRRTTQSEIDQFAVDVNEQFNQLDQTVKELLQFGFAWASIIEARQSTSIATSIKRLSWITFIFLPAMFASSLFGMNVDILESNPDWRWYLLFGGGCLTFTVFVWLLAKYGQTKWIKECLNACYRLPSEDLTAFRHGLKSGQSTLPK